MTKNIISVAAALLGAGALVAGCNIEQPEAGCIVQDASFANWYAKYDLKTDVPIQAGCESTILKGEPLGVFKFTNPGQAGEAKLTIRPFGLASRATRDPGDPYLQTAVGSLSEEPDDDSFCAASNFSEATVNAGARTGTNPEAATVISYKFDNVQVYSAPRAPGTQLKGELTYTRDGCTSRYSIRAIWPSVACTPGSSNPAESCGAGSGVNPDFDVECDKELERCVPVGAIPAFKAEE
jgi:hypothetical protein